MFGVLFLCMLEEDLFFLVDFEWLLYPFVELTPEAAPLISAVVSMSAEVSVVVPVESPMVPEVESLEVLVDVPIEVSVDGLLPFWAVRLGKEQHDAIMLAAVLGLV
jgi:hypothetical protein